MPNTFPILQVPASDRVTCAGLVAPTTVWTAVPASFYSPSITPTTRRPVGSALHLLGGARQCQAASSSQKKVVHVAKQQPSGNQHEKEPIAVVSQCQPATLATTPRSLRTYLYTRM